MRTSGLLRYDTRLQEPKELADMPEQGQDLVYESAGWEVDLVRRELRACGVPVRLGGRAFSILAVLVESAGELVTRDEIMARGWPSVIGEENTLHGHISAV